LLVDVVKSSLLNGITGGTFLRSINGTTINIASSSGGIPGSAGGPVCQYFEVTDATEDNVPKILVAQNQIANRWPLNMGPGTDPFELEITGNAYIYAAIYWDIESLVIGSDPDAIQIIQSPDLLQNTGTMQYILVATVVVTGAPPAIESITNVCSEPIPNPCVLDWSA
jgi:hypothetical protein